MTPTTGPPPLVGLVAALVVLIGGVAAAFSKDDTTPARTGPAITSSTLPRLASSTTVTPSIATTLPATTLPAATTTVRPAVPSPEAAANGLWATYSSNNRTAASRFASEAVVDALFANEYSGEDGTFGGCRKRSNETFDCDYSQPSAQYTMTAQADANHSFKIVIISIVR